MRNLHRMAARIFNTPLAVHPEKAGVIINAFSPILFGDIKVKYDDDEEEARCPDDEEYGGENGRCPDRDRRRLYTVTPEGIALIPIHGTLVHRQAFLMAESGLTSYGKIQTQVVEAMADERVKGIILDVDSAGGEVNGVFDLADVMAALRGEKPMYAVANDDAFSAAYLLASTADKVYVTQTGGTGSVGVIAVHLEQTEWEKNVGLNFTIFRAGKYKGEYGPHEALTEHAAESLQGELDRLYGMFTERIAQYRGMAEEAVRGTEAGLYFGEQGVDIGFADEVGTLDEAMEALSQEINDSSTPRGPLAAPSPFSQEDEMAGENGEKAGAAPPKAAEEKTPEPQVIDLDEARTKAEQAGADQAQARSMEVIQICNLAGHPEMIEQFISEGSDPAVVREALLAINAKASEAEQIENHVEPRTGQGVQKIEVSLDDVYARLSEGFKRNVKEATR